MADEQKKPLCSEEGGGEEEEAFSLLDRLELILDCDPLIDEVGFIHPSQLSILKEETKSVFPAEGQRTDTKESCKSPEVNAVEASDAFFWNRDHKLGISTTCLLPLYKAAKNKFMEALSTYKEYPCSTKDDNMSRSSGFSKIEMEVMRHSKALLLLSSDFGTAWNARKLVISKAEYFSVEDELILSALVLSFAAKSENAWNHRRWAIKRIAGGCASMEDILEKESMLVETIAEV